MAEKDTKDDYMAVKATLDKETLNILDQVCEKRQRKRNFIMVEVLDQWAFQDKWQGRTVITNKEEYADKDVSVKLRKDTRDALDKYRWSRKRSMSYIINEILTFWAMQVKDKIPEMVPD